MTDTTYAMALRTGNWGRLVMLPFHRPITVTLAPSDEPAHLVDLGSGAAAIPSSVTAGDIDSLTVADAGGRVVLRIDTSAGVVERRNATALASSSAWELRLEGASGLLILYSRDRARPSDEVLDRLAARVGATSAS